MTGPHPTPAQLAARAAWDEATSFLRELDGLLPLQDETDTLNRAAWDAYHAWQRAVERAKLAQHLADHDDGLFNAFEETR